MKLDPNTSLNRQTYWPRIRLWIQLDDLTLITWLWQHDFPHVPHWMCKLMLWHKSEVLKVASNAPTFFTNTTLLLDSTVESVVDACSNSDQIYKISSTPNVDHRGRINISNPPQMNCTSIMVFFQHFQTIKELFLSEHLVHLKFLCAIEYGQFKETLWMPMSD